MRRKTNLFYTEGPDSKFITFSNYTEALTGNYLSVNTKLFPDNFLCLKIGNLTNETKKLFIKYLVKYYENKLAALRDNNIANNENIEHNIYPLAYLLEAILKVVTKNEETGVYELNIKTIENNNIENDENNNITLVVNNLEQLEDIEEISNLITYIGEVSETDYYGTYTDIICNINCENYNEGVIKLEFNNSDNINEEYVIVENLNVESSENDRKLGLLYGWENEQIFKDYEDEEPIYDIENSYNVNSHVSQLIYHRIDNNSSENKMLEFNVIIPLFSVVNINDEGNSYNGKTTDRIDINEENCKYIKLNTTNKHIFDVPLGMWIYTDDSENSKYIELRKDIDMNVYPNWSLLISSQFKPFPYSYQYTKPNETSNNPYSKSIANSFNTFAEILSKMNDVLDNFNKMSNTISLLNERIDNIERNLKSIGTSQNIQSIEEKIINVENNVSNELIDFKKQLYGYLNNIKWSMG